MRSLEEIKESINKALADIEELETLYNEAQNEERENEEIELDDFEERLCGLWINIHDIATDAIESIVDNETQVRSFVKLKAITESMLDLFAKSDVDLDFDEE